MKMSKKMVTWLTLLFTVILLILGVVYKSAADNHKGVSISSGAIINGQYTEISSGKVGENKRVYEAYNTGGNTFFVLSGITMVICIGSIVIQKKRK